VIAQDAHEFKILQDRFRQAWRISALGPFTDFKKEFDDLMVRMDAARSASLTPPERFFKKARAKIKSGDYTFVADSKSSCRWRSRLVSWQAKGGAEYGIQSVCQLYELARRSPGSL